MEAGQRGGQHFVPDRLQIKNITPLSSGAGPISVAEADRIGLKFPDAGAA